MCWCLHVRRRTGPEFDPQTFYLESADRMAQCTLRTDLTAGVGPSGDQLYPYEVRAACHLRRLTVWPLCGAQTSRMECVTLSITSWQDRARGSVDGLSTSSTSLETMPPAKVSMPTASRAASAILAYQDRSSSNERPLCTSKLNTASERTVGR